jgi:hypothetical protein
MYDLTVPVLVRGLTVLSHYMDKAATHATERGFDPSILVNARLAPDMLSLAGQVQRSSDSAKGAMGRLAGVEVPSFPDTEQTFAELKERIQKTIAFLETVRPEQLSGSETKPVELKFRSVSTTLPGVRYLMGVLIPNFFFHVTTAHDILRHNGVNIGKTDYLGAST